MVRTYIFKVTDLYGLSHYILGTFETPREALRFMNEERRGVCDDPHDIEPVAVRFLSADWWDFECWRPVGDWFEQDPALRIVTEAGGWA